MSDFLCLKYLKFRNWIKMNNKGMGTVEIIIIIAVLVALALLFKTFILDMSETIFDKIRDKTNAAIDDL